MQPIRLSNGDLYVRSYKQSPQTLQRHQIKLEIDYSHSHKQTEGFYKKFIIKTYKSFRNDSKEKKELS